MSPIRKRPPRPGGAGEPGVLVLGWGNPGRGDDALGALLVERLEQEAHGRPDWARHRFVTDFQLQPEHALDFADAAQVLFVDASVSAPEPCALVRVQPAQDASFTTHALSPQALLAVHAQLERAPPPPAWLLGIRGEDFTLGAPLAPGAKARLARATQLARALLSYPSAAYWDRAAAAAPSTPVPETPCAAGCTS